MAVGDILNERKTINQNITIRTTICLCDLRLYSDVILTYSFQSVLVHAYFHVEISEVPIRCLRSCFSRLFVHARSPRSIHLLVLLLCPWLLYELLLLHSHELLLWHLLLHLRILLRLPLDLVRLYRSWHSLLLILLPITLGIQLLTSRLLLSILLLLALVIVVLISRRIYGENKGFITAASSG